MGPRGTSGPSTEQWHRLIAIVSNDDELRTGQFTQGPNGVDRLTRKWQELAEDVNLIGDVTKSGQKWKEAFLKLKSLAKTARNERLAYMKGTGGGVPADTAGLGLNDVYTACLNIMAPTCLDGNVDVATPLEAAQRQKSQNASSRLNDYRYRAAFSTDHNPAPGWRESKGPNRQLPGWRQSGTISPGWHQPRASFDQSPRRRQSGSPSIHYSPGWRKFRSSTSTHQSPGMRQSGSSVVYSPGCRQPRRLYQSPELSLCSPAANRSVRTTPREGEAAASHRKRGNRSTATEPPKKKLCFEDRIESIDGDVRILRSGDRSPQDAGAVPSHDRLEKTLAAAVQVMEKLHEALLGNTTAVISLREALFCSLTTGND